MKRIFAILIALLLIVALAACGEEESKTGGTTTDSGETSQLDTSYDAEKKAASKVDDTPSSTDNGESAKKYKTLEEYLQDPLNVQGVEEMKKNSQDNMDIDLRAEGDTLVYSFTYTTVYEEDSLPSIKSMLEQVMETAQDTFSNLAKMMQDDIEESITLKVVYCNGDGSVIAERTFEP